MLLSEEDVTSLAAAIEPGSSAGVVVWENTWAAPFGSAVRRSGGQLVASGRIPTQALLAAIEAEQQQQAAGEDAEFAATVLKGLEVTYNFGYTDAKYTKLKLAQNGSEADLSGNRQIFTPDITSLLALQYNISLIPSKQLQLIIRGEWIYLGTQYFDLANSITQSPYNLLNTKLGLKIKHAELYFWERNMANIKYIAYGYDFGAVHLGNPRTFGFTFRASM